MKKPELTPRLLSLAQRVPKEARLADVGTDHAYLPVFLLLEGRISEAVATDIHAGPLEQGKKTAQQFGVMDKLSFYCCNGLASVTPEQADTVVIAGMGGELISHILEAAPWTKQALLLLQPMSTQPELRRWLTENGYCILEDISVSEGQKFYSVLTVTGGACAPYTLGELWAGRQSSTQKDPHRLGFLDDLIRRRELALAGKKQSRKQSAAEAEEALLQELIQMREEWKRWYC